MKLINSRTTVRSYDSLLPADEPSILANYTDGYSSKKSGFTHLGDDKPLILIVEDHDDTRVMLRTSLEMENFSVLEAVDGQTAVATALIQRPDLILMDLTIPKLNGVEATKIIRKDQWAGAMPIIFLSGSAEPASQQDAFDAGGNDYLIKPVSIEEMFIIMKRWIPHKYSTASIHSPLFE